MNKLHKEPLLHFLLIGAALFALNAWRANQRTADDASAQRIEVTATVVQRLSEGYERQFGRMPDEEELRGLVTAHIREEVLYREALALGLDRDDMIVRRRLAQKMEFLTDDIASAATTDDTAVRTYFETNAERYAKSPRMSFRHVYFSREKRGASAESAAAEALTALEKGASEESFGDAFLHGFEFADREAQEITALLGSEFTAGAAALPMGKWRGPVISSYGLHLVRIDSREAAQPSSFDAVRETVLRDFNEERRREANREAFEKLRARYQVSVDEAALAKAAAPTNNTAQR